MVLGQVDASSSVFEWVFGFAIFLGIVLLGGCVLIALRRRLAKVNTVDLRPGFTLDELRRLRDQGDLTIPEYDALKRKVTEDLRASLTSESGGKAVP